MRAGKRLGVVAALVAGVVLAACGDDGGSGGDGDVRTVVVWDRAGAEADARKAFLDEWNKTEGPKVGLKIQYEPQATEKYEEVVRLGFQTQRAPDIFHAPSSQLGAMVAAGWVQPLDGLIDDALLDEAQPYLADDSELVWGGRPYAIPTTTFTVRMAINKDLFREAGLDPEDPPTTFSEVEEAARAITESGNEVYGVGIPMGWVGFLAWTTDLPLLAADANLTQEGLFNLETGTFEAEKYEPIVEHFRTLIEDGAAYPGAETMDYDQFLSSFAEGKVGMVLTSGSIVGGLQQLDSDIDFGVGPIPVPDGMTQERAPTNAGFPYAISSTTEDPEAAAEEFAVMVGPDMQAALAENGIPPLSEEAWDHPVAKDNEWLQLFRPTDSDEQWPKKPGSLVSVEGKDATTTVVELILNPKADAAKALSQLSERYQKAYEEGVDNGEVDPTEFGLD